MVAIRVLDWQQPKEFLECRQLMECGIIRLIRDAIAKLHIET
jgi:hypothetical protein